MKVIDRVESDAEVMQIILGAVCRITSIAPYAISSNRRLWMLMYARYIFFDTALKFHIKPSDAVMYIGRNRTLAYPYKNAIDNLNETDAQFRADCNRVYESVIEYLGYDRY